jgi:hypothetical protein
MTYEDVEFKFTEEQWAEAVAWIDDQMLNYDKREARMREWDRQRLSKPVTASGEGKTIIVNEGETVATYTDLNDFAKAHVDLLHENEQLRARHKEQLRIIEEKREKIVELTKGVAEMGKSIEVSVPSAIARRMKELETKLKRHEDIVARYFCLLQYHRNQFEAEATYEEIEIAATGHLYPFKEEG